MIGLLGGTFDPIHIGHLRCALDLCDELQLSHLKLIPAFIPPLRDQPQVSAAQRLDMLRLAIAGEGRLQVDERELQRPGPSYSLDTLKELRVEFGSQPLLFAIGADAFANLHRWHQWEALFDYAHIIVMGRPTHGGVADPRVLAQLQQRQVEDVGALADCAHGGLYQTRFVGLPISASGIREKVLRGESIRYLVPDAVCQYIRTNGFYQ